MITRDVYGNYTIKCDACTRYSTAQPVESAARSWAAQHGWAQRDGRDLCPWCAEDSGDPLSLLWRQAVLDTDKEVRDDPR